MLTFEATIFHSSFGIAFNIHYNEDAVCYISDGYESILVKKMLDYINNLFDNNLVVMF